MKTTTSSTKTMTPPLKAMLLNARPTDSLLRLVCATSMFFVLHAASAIDGEWTSTASGTQLWSTESNWSSDPDIPGGANSTVKIESHITANTTIDLLGVSRTIGSLSIGEEGRSGNPKFIIASSGGASLIFNRTGGAQLTFNGDGHNEILAAVVLDSDLAITANVSPSKLQTIGGIVSGTGAITQSGAGRIYLNRSNTFSGGYTLNRGELTAGSNRSLGTGTVTLNGGTFHIVNTLNYSNVMNLGGSVALTGNGNANTKATFSGPVTLTADSQLTTSNAMPLQELVISGDISGNYNFVKAGAGGDITFSGTNTHTGYTEVREGGLNLKGGAAIADTAEVRVSGGTLRISGAVSNETIGSLVMSGGLIDTADSGVSLTVAGNMSFTDSGTVNAQLAGGTATLTKTGAGTLILNRADGSTYGGATFVNEGTLLINNASGSGTGAGAVIVERGATLGGNGIISGATTIDGSLRPGNSIGTLTVANDVTWNAGDAWVFELGSAAVSLVSASSGSSSQDQLLITGTASDFLKGSGSDWTFDFLGGGEAGWYKLVNWTGTTSFTEGDFKAVNLASGLSGSFVVDAPSSTLYFTVIPEPSTWALLAGSLGFLWIFSRRRKSSRA